MNETWDLSVFYQSFQDPALRADIDAIKELAAGTEALLSAQKPDADKLEDVVRAREKLTNLLNKTYGYVELTLAADTNHADALRYLGEMSNLMVDVQLAGSQFVGTHDFAAVRSVGTEVKSTVRTVYYYEVARKGDVISLRVCANGFLYNMARAMAGTVVYAAEGKFPPESVAEILEHGDRKAAGPTVPPGGLYMTQLWYDDGEVSFHVGSSF